MQKGIFSSTWYITQASAYGHWTSKCWCYISQKHSVHLGENNTAAKQYASAWLSGYAKRIGERMPHTEQIHLPSFLTEVAVYDMMVTELTEQGRMKLSLCHTFMACGWQDFQIV